MQNQDWVPFENLRPMRQQSGYSPGAVSNPPTIRMRSLAIDSALAARAPRSRRAWDM